jgi:signal peptidase II
MVARWLWGPLSALGLTLAALTVLADQAHKAWMLYVYDIGAKGTVTLTPFFDLVLVWNPGISYGLFPQDSALGRVGLILFAFVASLALIVWLARVTSRLTAFAIGLIIGGAIGNAIGFEWYVFNIADVAIVAGVVGLLYESLVAGHKKAGKPSKM